MTDKTPEEQAREHANDNVSLFDGDYEQEIRERLILAWLRSYHSRDTEIAELKKQLNKAQDPYAE